MSARISGVKNFESKAASLVRGLPFSQVQSQSEKGTIFSFFADAVSGDGLGVCAIHPLRSAVAGAVQEWLFAAGGPAKFAAVTAGTFGPPPVFAVACAGAASL